MTSSEHENFLADSLLELSIDALVQTDGADVIQRFNAAAEDLFSYSAEEVIGRKLFILFPEEEWALHQHESLRKGGLDTLGATVRFLRVGAKVKPSIVE